MSETKVSEDQREKDEIFTRVLLSKLTGSDLAALAEPMGLAVVPLSVTSAMFLSAQDCDPSECPASHEEIYNSMIEAGRIKPETLTAPETIEVYDNIDAPEGYSTEQMDIAKDRAIKLGLNGHQFSDYIAMEAEDIVENLKIIEDYRQDRKNDLAQKMTFAYPEILPMTNQDTKNLFDKGLISKDIAALNGYTPPEEGE